MDTPGFDPEVAYTLPIREGYDQWSETYDTDGNPLIAVEEPVVAEFLGEVSGQSILDLGCGTGRHALRLADAGAEVTAVDFSDGMLRKARAKPGADRIRFIVHDMTGVLPFGDDAFDRVICCLVVEHLTELPPLFAQMRRVCRRDGFIVVSAMHPAMFLCGSTARFIDPKTGRRIAVESGPQSISELVLAALDSGCLIDHLSEHVVDEALAIRLERAKRYLGWPMLFAMRMRPGS